MESESMVETMKRSAQTRTPSRMSAVSPMTQSLNVPLPAGSSSFDFDLPAPNSHLNDVIALAKNEIKKEKKKVQRKRKTSQR